MINIELQRKGKQAENVLSRKALDKNVYNARMSAL
jgi:hypothetical protein